MRYRFFRSYPVLSPFYVFQLFSVILWYLDAYEIYASSILVTTVLSIILTVWTIRSGRKNLQKMVSKHNSNKAIVFREKWHPITTSELVPGDLIKLQNGQLIPADCVLIE